jgi:hypothetical protein
MGGLAGRIVHAARVAPPESERHGGLGCLRPPRTRSAAAT